VDLEHLEIDFSKFDNLERRYILRLLRRRNYLHSQNLVGGINRGKKEEMAALEWALTFINNQKEKQ
jgi:hypothetical protein